MTGIYNTNGFTRITVTSQGNSKKSPKESENQFNLKFYACSFSDMEQSFFPKLVVSEGEGGLWFGFTKMLKFIISKVFRFNCELGRIYYS